MSILDELQQTINTVAFRIDYLFDDHIAKDHLRAAEKYYQEARQSIRDAEARVYKAATLRIERENRV